MKFSIDLEINLPREKVIELFDNQENMKKWQPDLISFEPFEGTPGQVGAKTRLVYDMQGREVEMVETVKVRNVPDELSGTYDTEGVFNELQNRFEATPDGNTIWRCTSEFKFSGPMKLIGPTLRSSFEEHTRKIMTNFKTFAEQA